MKIIDRSGDEQSFILTFLVCTAVYAHKAQWFFLPNGAFWCMLDCGRYTHDNNWWMYILPKEFY